MRQEKMNNFPISQNTSTVREEAATTLCDARLLLKRIFNETTSVIKHDLEL